MPQVEEKKKIGKKIYDKIKDEFADCRSGSKSYDKISELVGSFQAMLAFFGTAKAVSTDLSEKKKFVNVFYFCWGMGWGLSDTSPGCPFSEAVQKYQNYLNMDSNMDSYDSLGEALDLLFQTSNDNKTVIEKIFDDIHKKMKIISK